MDTVSIRHVPRIFNDSLSLITEEITIKQPLISFNYHKIGLLLAQQQIQPLRSSVS